LNVGASVCEGVCAAASVNPPPAQHKWKGLRLEKEKSVMLQKNVNNTHAAPLTRHTPLFLSLSPSLILLAHTTPTFTMF